MFFILQLVSIASETMLALHRDDLDKVVEHGVQRERSQNLSQMQALKAETEQAKKELAEKKGQNASYLEKIGDLKVAANVQAQRRHRPEENQRRAEKERKDMVGKLAMAIEDRIFAEDSLFAERERSDDLVQELAIH